MSAAEKVIIDLCSSEEEEEDVFGDENNYDETEEEEDEDTNSRSVPLLIISSLNLFFLGLFHQFWVFIWISEDDSDWSHDDDDATESDVEADEIGVKGDNDDGDEDDKVTRLLTGFVIPSFLKPLIDSHEYLWDFEHSLYCM